MRRRVFAVDVSYGDESLDEVVRELRSIVTAYGSHMEQEGVALHIPLGQAETDAPMPNHGQGVGEHHITDEGQRR